MNAIAARSTRKTIALTDLHNGWVFRLHADERRVWLDSYSTDAPVPLSYVAGSRVGELEWAMADSRDTVEMMDRARRLLSGRIAVSALEDIRAAA